MTADRCLATNPYRYAWWVVPGEQCTRPTGHDGPHTIPQRSQDGLLLANAQWFWWPEKTVAADEPVSVPPPAPHICDYVEPDGATHGVCHLPGEHGGRQRADELAVEKPPADRTEFKLADLVLDPHHVPNEHGWGRIESASPVPPLVDAPVDHVQEVIETARIYGRLCYQDGHRSNELAKDQWPVVARAARALWASGVAEGRKIAEAEFDNRSTYELAGLVHRYLHVEAPDNSDPVQVAIEVLEEAIQDHGTVVTLETRGVAEGRRQLEHAEKVAAVHAYELGMAEGRRQATEEARTAAQISTFLDTEEGQLHLRKLIRTGQIVLPHG